VGIKRASSTTAASLPLPLETQKPGQSVYGAVVNHLDDRLRAAGDFGLIVMDGDGSDSSY
jgi:hypothetical protein